MRYRATQARHHLKHSHPASLWSTTSLKKTLTSEINTNLYPSITESGRLRADISAEIAWEMVDDLFLTVSTTTQYDSGKPGDEVTRNEKLDYNVVMGVSWRP